MATKEAINNQLESSRYVSSRTVVATREITPGQFGFFDGQEAADDMPEIREIVDDKSETENDDNGVEKCNPYEEIIPNPNPTQKELAEHKLRLINRRKWERVESVREEMKKNGDKRSLFLIKAGTYIRSSESKKVKGKYFEGLLRDDVLAVINKENKKLELIRFFISEPIAVAYISPGSGERRFNSIDLKDKYNVSRTHDPENRKTVFVSQQGNPEKPHQSLNSVLDIKDFLNLLAKR